MKQSLHNRSDMDDEEKGKILMILSYEGVNG